MLDSKYMGVCPLHPEAVIPCVCCTSAVTNRDLIENVEIGMGRWQCANNHQVVGPPIVNRANKAAYCPICGVSMFHVDSGVYRPAER